MSDPIVPFVIDHDMYNKISDDIIQLGSNCIVRFNVTLSTLNKENEREHYHKEFSYFSPKNNCNIITMRRSFQYYLSIENIKYDYNTNTKDCIIVGVKEFFRLKMVMEQVIRWFLEDYNDIYEMVNGEIQMISHPEEAVLTRLPGARAIVFEAVIITYQDCTSTPGVRMYLSDNNFVEFNADTVFGLYYQIQEFNMHLYAQNMINYLGRPDFGTNLIDMNNIQQENYKAKTSGSGKGVSGRTIGG